MQKIVLRFRIIHVKSFGQAAEINKNGRLQWFTQNQYYAVLNELGSVFILRELASNSTGKSNLK